MKPLTKKQIQALGFKKLKLAFSDYWAHPDYNIKIGYNYNWTLKELLDIIYNAGKENIQHAMKVALGEEI